MCQTRLVLSKVEYLKATGKHFLLTQLLRFSGWTCMLELARSKEKNKGTREEPNLREVDIRKEAMGLIFRSSQKHFSVKEWSEITIDGIGCLHFRIEKEVARQIYGTQNVPILNYKDPVTAKFVRDAHWIKGDVCRGVHNLTKSTLSNVVKGEAAAFWKGQQRQIKGTIRECGICRRFDEKLCQPHLGKSLF